MPGVRILVDTVKVPRLAETLQHLSQTGAGFGKILESLIAAYEDGYHMQQQQGSQNAGSSESFLDERPKKTVRFALDDAPSKPLNVSVIVLEMFEMVSNCIDVCTHPFYFTRLQMRVIR